MATTKRKTETKKVTRYLRVSLSRDELLAAGKNHADKTIELSRLESDRKRIADEFKAKISAIEAQVQNLANVISTGYEYRDVKCTAHLGEPEPDSKRILRDDTGEEVAIEKMTQEEMQKELLDSED
jgi:hypothetical protein